LINALTALFTIIFPSKITQLLLKNSLLSQKDQFVTRKNQKSKWGTTFSEVRNGEMGYGWQPCIGQSIIYNYVTPIPPDGHWDGIFMQVAFPGPENTILTLTTETLIIPNTYPIGPCSGEECHGTLV
jgi:hypothetical protein